VRYTSGLGERVQFWDINRPAYQNQDLDLRFFYIQMFIGYRNTLTFSQRNYGYNSEKEMFLVQLLNSRKAIKLSSRSI